MLKGKKSLQTYFFIAIIAIIFLLSFVYSTRRNFRKGVYVDDRFFYVTSSTLLESDDQNQISLKSNDSGIDFTTTIDGSTQTANLKWDSEHVTITYQDGSVFEGDWNGKQLLDQKGNPVKTDSGENGALSYALCQISQNKLVSRHSLLTIVLGIAFYLIGAMEFLDPSTYHFFLRGWRSRNKKKSEDNPQIEKLGGIIVMIIGVIAITGLFTS